MALPKVTSSKWQIWDSKTYASESGIGISVTRLGIQWLQGSGVSNQPSHSIPSNQAAIWGTPAGLRFHQLLRQEVALMSLFPKAGKARPDYWVLRRERHLWER